VSELQEDNTPLYTERKASRKQRTMARRMAESKAQIPHFYTSLEIDVTGMIEHRHSLKESGASCPSVNDFFVYGVAQALQETPSMNVQYHDEMVRQFEYPSVGVAIATEAGLMVPIIKNTASLSLEEVKQASLDLAERARSKALTPEDFEGGTFTVSNVGTFGLTQSWPIINPPESGILGVGAARPQAVFIDGEFKQRQIVTVTLSADHRVLDGSIVGPFLAHLKAYLEALA